MIGSRSHWDWSAGLPDPATGIVYWVPRLHLPWVSQGNPDFNPSGNMMPIL